MCTQYQIDSYDLHMNGRECSSRIYRLSCYSRSGSRARAGDKARAGDGAG